MYISVRIVAVWKLKGSYHAFSCSFIITHISLDSYQSASHCKFNAVPEELLSNLTMSEKPYIWSYLCDANTENY